MKPRVYIAGPYTQGDPLTNTHRAMDAWHELADHNIAPFCPHLFHFLHERRERPYKEWLAHDLVWLETCHAVLRLDGDSPGADREVKKAQKLGLPIFHNTNAVLAWANRWNTTP